jgi:exopolyphosphatase/guanosine-5'-triphosphate,3'-diphosphate pyrophosphatase
MQIAAIDIGTNSLHMIIARTGPDGSFEIVGREKDMVRLGAGGLDGRALGESTMAAALQTLTRFKRLAESRGVDQIKAVATSAVREAPNGGEFLRTVDRETGIRARIISGLEEARLIHRAAMHAVDVGSSTAVVIDIGGGSTEITCGTAAGPQVARSFHLGVIRLSERFVQSDPLSDRDERRLVRRISSALGHELDEVVRRGFDRVIGTSGTILSLGALALGAGGTPVASELQLHHSRVSAKALHKLRKDIVGLPLADRLKLPGLDSRRADLVVSGAVLLDTILRHLGAHEITLCDVSLREGVVLEYIESHRSDIERIESYPDIRKRSVIDLAQRCRYRAEHALHVAALSLSLFDQLRAVHGLDARAREWLEYSALLHDVGEHISYENHHRHSYYLIKNGGLRGFEPNEIEVIALAARYHRRGTPKKTHRELEGLPRGHRGVVRWLAAMLRVAESLDRSHGQIIGGVTVQLEGPSRRLRVWARGDAQLEAWAAQRNTGALEALLDGPIHVEIEEGPPPRHAVRPGPAARRHRQPAPRRTPRRSKS